ncbi:DUF885 domain-containing protein [Corynebacterium hadale]|uniref:DUF885 domain-containing protein n=1 Tax=Corynebacterium hadale TaxID=2026255 RepID=UPI001EF2F8B0|nr:DUF885 domain-containing protein [Corynebacterium hadale]MCG7254263.1 DUF885 domain-containing protein [Corynebacterium hadale]MCG7257054.1 DUF885 domain-containing protein [Corynebacterium hadale]MCG7265780.1 DUF885 domain-containing protein [Corynebacterium hadale]
MTSVLPTEPTPEHAPGAMPGREPSLLDATCEDFVYDYAQLTPTLGTQIGLEGFDADLQDFSPEYWDATADRIRDLIADVDALNDSTDASDDEDDFDEVDSLTATILRDRLAYHLELHHQGEFLRRLNNIESPVQTIRDSFLLMPKVTEEDFDNVAARLSKVPDALCGYTESLSEAANTGNVASHRQIDAVINQCETLGESGSTLDYLGLPPESKVVEEAKEAFAKFADWLSTELSPQANHEDGVGRDRYELFSEYFLGREVDLDEAYAWAEDELRVTVDKQQALARQLYGAETSVPAAYRRLNEDDRYTLHGTDALLEWLDKVNAEVVECFAGSELDIPEDMPGVNTAIDRAGSGGVFYTPPSDDMLRPGTMWWSVPEGQETFHTWQELSTVFHEGIPGHHLQHGAALLNRNELNLWRRSVCFNSAHGEGWALYAEHLMENFGWFEDPGYLMGLLDSRRLRLARVMVDIGVHLKKLSPDGSGTWDAQYAKAFLRDNCAMPETRISFELDRYMGWPGQAPSYAIGYRDWCTLRERALAQGMTAAQFHTKALGLGSMPMDMLAHEVLNH